MSKTRLIPVQAFEYERSYLNRLPPHLPAPYVTHERTTDQYGYIAFQGNYYWVPGTKRDTVKVLQYADRLTIFHRRNCLAEYSLPADGVRNAQFTPQGEPRPAYLPKHRRHGAQQEEKRLRGMGPEVNRYVDYVVKTRGIQRHRFLRELFRLSQQVSPAVFSRAVERALRYRVVDIDTVRRIAWLYIGQGESYLPDVEVDETYRQRPAYQEGYLTDEPDLSIYDEMFSEDDTDQAESEEDDE
jgi:hypothetical protein